LKSQRGFSQIQHATLPAIKEYLIARGIPCRPPAREGVPV
jgi:hypothetical protein